MALVLGASYKIQNVAHGGYLNLHGKHAGNVAPEYNLVTLYSRRDGPDQEWRARAYGNGVRVDTMRNPAKVLCRDPGQKHCSVVRTLTAGMLDVAELDFVTIDAGAGLYYIRQMKNNRFLTAVHPTGRLWWQGFTGLDLQRFKLVGEKGGGSAPAAASYQWPTPSTKINQRFSSAHPQWDIAPVTSGVPGDPIYSVHEGVCVRRFDWVASQGIYGNASLGCCLFIQGDNPAPEIGGRYLRCLYAHMQPNLQVAAGQRVRKGQLIGYMGNTGATSGATGVHLHLGMQAADTGYSEAGTAAYINGDWVDPGRYFAY